MLAWSPLRSATFRPALARPLGPRDTDHPRHKRAPEGARRGRNERCTDGRSDPHDRPPAPCRADRRRLAPRIAAAIPAARRRIQRPGPADRRPPARRALAEVHGGPTVQRAHPHLLRRIGRARRAVGPAADLLAPREAILASFLEPVDDLALLRMTLPWSPSATTQRRLARLDRREDEFLTQLSTEGAALAGRRGVLSRPLAIEGRGSASDRLLDAAATARASCIVVGHRSAATPLDSTGLALGPTARA